VAVLIKTHEEEENFARRPGTVLRLSFNSTCCLRKEKQNIYPNQRHLLSGTSQPLSIEYDNMLTSSSNVITGYHIR
jgi:hypothetical protein